MVEARKQFGKGRRNSDKRSRKNLSVETLLRTYQNDVEKKKILLRKAGVTRSEIMFLTQSLKALFSDENFVTLLRAEGLSNIPKTIADRLTRIDGAMT